MARHSLKLIRSPLHFLQPSLVSDPMSSQGTIRPRVCYQTGEQLPRRPSFMHPNNMAWNHAFHHHISSAIPFKGSLPMTSRMGKLTGWLGTIISKAVRGPQRPVWCIVSTFFVTTPWLWLLVRCLFGIYTLLCIFQCSLYGSTLVCRVIILLELSEVPLFEPLAWSVRIQLAVQWLVDNAGCNQESHSDNCRAPRQLSQSDSSLGWPRCQDVYNSMPRFFDQKYF